MTPSEWNERAIRRSQCGLGVAVLLYLAALAAAWLVASSVEAQARPIPRDQWTPDVHLLLGRCVVGEAGWRSQVDHDAIPWVLARRWRTRDRNTVGEWTFAAQVRDYCKAANPRGLGRQWVRRLPSSTSEEWPHGAGPNERRWWRILDRLRRWARGHVHDPCKASHWGGMEVATDRRRAERAVSEGRWRRVQCAGNPLNAFFARVPR